MKMETLYPPVPMNVYSETIPFSSLLFSNTCYFILTTQHKPNPLVDSLFPLLNYIKQMGICKLNIQVIKEIDHQISMIFKINTTVMSDYTFICLQRP